KLLYANFSGAVLRAVKFRKVELMNAKLTQAILDGADLSEASLLDADFTGADLRNANLYGANLMNARFKGADLRNAELASAILFGTDFDKADLRGANLEGVQFGEKGKTIFLPQLDTAFRPTTLKGAKFDEKTVLPFDRSESLSRGMIEVSAKTT